MIRTTDCVTNYALKCLIALSATFRSEGILCVAKNAWMTGKSGQEGITKQR